MKGLTKALALSVVAVVLLVGGCGMLLASIGGNSSFAATCPGSVTPGETEIVDQASTGQQVELENDTTIANQAAVNCGSLSVDNAIVTACAKSSDTTVGGQSLTAEQLSNLAIIKQIGQSRGFSDRDILEAVADSLWESGLRNLDHGNGTSVGLFQLIDINGTFQQRLDPVFSTNWHFDQVATIPIRGMLDIGEIAYRAQRPLNHEAYVQAVDSQVPLAEKLLGLSCLSSVAGGGVPGKVIFTPDANLPGKPVAPATMAFLEKVAGIYGQQLVCTTGTNHSMLTTDGNVSDHYTGNACDFLMSANGGTDDGPVGDAIDTACLEAAGVLPVVAALDAGRGGLETIAPNIANGGLRIQCIWKTDQGGNHHNHVHIGANPNG